MKSEGKDSARREKSKMKTCFLRRQRQDIPENLENLEILDNLENPETQKNPPFPQSPKKSKQI